jgi:hypothetical protein
MKSRSSNPDLVRDVALQGGEGGLAAPDQPGDDGRIVSIGTGAPKIGVKSGSSSVRVATKSPRSRMVSSASPMSGSDLPRAST